ncbi:MAG TPA: N,N-dimethylformamidase beta subunit family domain-containing protein, partial [Ktedonobacteraceae bacterium]
KKAATTQIQAYVGARSVAPGHSLSFYVSTQHAGTRYEIRIYRMGWYQGMGGRLMTTIRSQVGQAQGYFNKDVWALVHCSTCHVDKKTGLIEARWKQSYSLIIPYDWTTGVYLVKLIDEHGFQTYTDFDVTGNDRAAYAVVTADTTYAAYNNWGGRSLYMGKPAPAVKVSFLRPSTQQQGSDQVLVFEANAIHWLERNGYDLSYMSNVDLQTNAAQLLKHKAYISLGHVEYWSKEMFDGVEKARDHGVGLAFLEANAAYWQIRFERGTTGSANSTIVCYKVSTGHKDLARDPLYGHDNERVTARWHDPVINRPENTLIGMMYSHSTHVQQRAFPWKLNKKAQSTLLHGTGLVPGQKYGCGLVGYEWDKVVSKETTPRGLQILATSATVNIDGKPDTSNTTVYIAPSGAMVFATGSVYWMAALDTYRYKQVAGCAGKNVIVRGMQRLMSNVMAELVVPHHQQFRDDE